MPSLKDTEEEGDHGILGEEAWSQKWGQHDSSTAGGRWRRLLETELDRGKWSVGHAALGATRHKSSPVKSSATSLFKSL